jgi:2-amino-4-deoxychorismate synthase
MDRLPEGPFALIRRAGEDRAELLRGPFEHCERLADLPTGGGDVLALVPYRQLTERGDACHDDGAPLLAMRIAQRRTLGLDELPYAAPPVVRDGAFDIGDDDYARSVKAVLDEEIAHGEGANFVLRRTFTGRCGTAPGRGVRENALGAFRALLENERGAYWTFLIDTGGLILVGATPERHVSLSSGVAVMNPISGTLRRPPGTASREQILAFLDDPKERDELAMVVDEELKMLAAVGDLGGRVTGPHLKEMAHLAHTEYYIEARTTMDPRAILRETMFAPTSTGSPLRNAFRVIERHETGGRGYYGAVAALIGADGDGRPTMDAPLLLRVAYLDPDGTVRIPVGATLVRGSDPYEEVRETHAKAAGVLRAFGVVDGPSTGRAAPGQEPSAAAPVCWSDDPQVQAALSARNGNLAPFWLREHAAGSLADPRLAGRSVVIIDNEDAFTSMLAVQVRTLGMAVRRIPFEQAAGPHGPDAAGPDLVVLGPGPGDPRDGDLPKIRAGRAALDRLARERRPVLAVCLGHQMLCEALGFALIRKAEPDQGRQREVDLFGTRRLVGFYNSFTALAAAPGSPAPGTGPAAEVAALDDGQVVAVRAVLHGTPMTGLQFHPESILTYDGLEILREEVVRLLGGGGLGGGGLG